jgi:hypothetical protein
MGPQRSGGEKGGLGKSGGGGDGGGLATQFTSDRAPSKAKRGQSDLTPPIAAAASVARS